VCSFRTILLNDCLVVYIICSKVIVSRLPKTEQAISPSEKSIGRERTWPIIIGVSMCLDHSRLLRHFQISQRDRSRKKSIVIILQYRIVSMAASTGLLPHRRFDEPHIAHLQILHGIQPPVLSIGLVK
jgi:hypothetical protein